MGNPTHPILDSSKKIYQGNGGQMNHTTKPSSLTLRERVLVTKKTKATKSSRNVGHLIRRKRSGSIILMKRSRASPLEGNNKERRRCGIKSRVKTLKKLVPNTESMELDVLFRETADYIMSLEMRVRVMQNMVQLLTGSDSGD